ncbi:right-handed parallel beta-helix repeat-containing protein [Spirosoma taeanense]|uniref:Right-handed parallel beta-helix repeat-containing protein n=1 Tax=Spirosoma taeanense TaxID=2735870 RepID=A0A6M5Y035_9BACT|nr:right-handed parallel beta-helix repeat-containing protein [Spirosoma taeanense]QJW88148.1 right-handed parallel beta-helix repeat-containing protein [Spirosoma taeanense]
MGKILIHQLCFVIISTWSLSLAKAQQAQCACDYVIKTSGVYQSKDINPLPGSTICIQAGTYDRLKFIGFAGDSTKPLRFVNLGGRVVLKSLTAVNALEFTDCRHFIISGGGQKDLKYGFVAGASYKDITAVHVNGKSSNFEIERIEVNEAGFAGLMIKADPTCDSTTWRSHFTMANVHVHDNYIHDVAGEGMYIGNSFWGQGQARTCAGQSVRVLPHNILKLHIHHNLVERTGCEGIQIGCAPDFDVHHNIVRTAGIKPFTADQDNGVQIGGGAGGKLHHNYFEDAQDVGLIIVGHLGDLMVANNAVINSKGVGVFCDERTGSLPNVNVRFINNTFINTGEDGFRLYNETQKNSLINNVIVNINTKNSTDPFKYISFGQQAKAEEMNNVTTQTVASLKFLDQAIGNFRLTAGSPLIDKGTDVSSLGITSDLADRVRPQGAGFDIGAFEFGEQQAIAPTLVATTCETASKPNTITLQPGVKAPPWRLLQRLKNRAERLR